MQTTVPSTNTISTSLPCLEKLECSDFVERVHHTSARIKNLVVTYAGKSGLSSDLDLSTVTALDLDKLSTQYVEPDGKTPGPRCGHTACLFNENKILIYGGHIVDTVTNQVLIMTITSMDPFLIDWEVKQAPVENEPRRSFHISEIYQNYMYIFGGVNETLTSMNDLWSMSLESFTWTKCHPSGEIPSKRCKHSSVVYKQEIYIFGGEDNASNHLNDLFKLNLPTMTWSKIVCELNPSPRRSTSAQVNDGLIYITGGTRDNENTSNQIFTYDINNNNWQEIRPTGIELPPVARPTSTFYQDRLIIWGGADRDNVISSSIYRLSLCKEIFSMQYNYVAPEVKRAPSLKTNITKPEEYVYQMKQLLVNRDFTDCSVEVEGKSFPAHRCLLASRCKYFYDLFTSNSSLVLSYSSSSMLDASSEGDKSIIKIGDIKASTFQMILDFLYANQINLTQNLAFDLLRVVDKFSLSKLREKCEKFLISSLTLDNLAELANFADQQQAKKLMNEVVSFMQKNMKSLEDQEEIVLELPKAILVKCMFMLNHKLSQ